MSFPKKGKIYTYADYLSWPEGERIELIGGTPSFQAAPSRTHQKILSELHRQLANYLLGKNVTSILHLFMLYSILTGKMKKKIEIMY